MRKIPGKVIFVFLMVFPLLSYTTTNEWDRESKHEISTGGFYFIEDAGRSVFNFNVGWRFFKGSAPEAVNPAYEDQNWELVNLPHGLELLPDEASGSINYQGEAWYRKKFSVPKELEGKKVYLNFEAIMGKSKVWINGKLAGEHFGGYLPLIIDATAFLHYGTTKNCIAVLADNSDDELYPPGRSQRLLDFSYFGGIYRDVWLISMDQLHITNPNYVDKAAGGGVFVHYENLTKDNVTVVVKTDVQNESGLIREFRLETIIKDVKGNVAGQAIEQIKLGPNSSIEINQEIDVNSPDLWSPETPHLYNLYSLVKEGNAKVTDGFKTRIGIRKIEFLGKKGFYLNNEPYEGKLMGANRHQDFGYVGNAVSNSMHWRDVKKLKEAGMDVIRTAHYPQDPAFMDACDELGLFYIEAIPGWQFWNDDSIFINRAYSDVRNMIRRIRNRPSVLLWEPILNEARYPEEFAKRAVEITKEEYPFQGCYTACDAHRESSKYFDVLYSHTYAFKDMHTRYLKNNKENQLSYALDYSQSDKSYFTREWGDAADHFGAQNSPSRAHRSWGETPQLIQSLHYANPDYLYTSYHNICLTPRQHVGGCLWHSFDHQRGYFPDAFYGGIMDIFRQPKYSYYMFMSQQKPGSIVDGKVVEPMVYITNEMTPFSPSDVVVFSNCDAVSLTVLDEPIDTIATSNEMGMPYLPAIFKDAYRFYDLKARFRAGDREGVEILAEGIIDGKVEVTTVKKPSMRPTKIHLEADFSGRSLIADGSDFLVVIASITDDEGNVKRLNNKQIIFEVSGEGELIGDVSIGANPRKIGWGTAPALIRATTKPGTIKVKAKLDERYFHTAKEATLEIITVPPPFKLLYDESKTKSAQKAISNEKDTNEQVDSETIKKLKKQLQETQYELNKLKLQKVEKEQERIEEGNKQK